MVPLCHYFVQMSILHAQLFQVTYGLPNPTVVWPPQLSQQGGLVSCAQLLIFKSWAHGTIPGQILFAKLFMQVLIDLRL